MKPRNSRFKHWLLKEHPVLKYWLDALKNMAEILAIIAAGIVAYFYTFGVKDKPMLEHRGKVESELSWTKIRGAEACQADFRVKFENIGTTSFDISKVHLRAWEFGAITLGREEFARYLDVNSIERNGPTFFDKIYDIKALQKGESWTPFLGHYAPGSTWEHSFQFVVKRVPDRWVLFMVELFEEENQSTPKDAAYQWESVCGDQGEEKRNNDSQNESPNSNQ